MVLADGGNAIEAMVAMAATIAVVYPHMNHLGGDGIWLLREPAGRIRALMAIGCAAANARRELYRDYQHIPPRGPLAVLTVPGAVAGWMLALEAAHAHGGRTPVADLLAPAIRRAREGYAVSRSQARLTTEKLSELKDMPGFARVFLAEGKPPDPGAPLKQEALAATLDHLAYAGLADFYRGDIAREMAADLEAVGSPLTRDDLTRFRARAAEPLSIALEDATVFNAPPPSQGLAALLILALFDRLPAKQAETFDHFHGLIEATKRAFSVRDRVITDPDRLPYPVERCLDARFLDAEELKIDRRKAAAWSPSAADAGDTIWMGAADASGLVVSYIQSLYWEFGSGVVLPRTGVLMQNRGISFSLNSASLNALETGRLPFHTLCPALAVLRDGRIMAYGTMGGDGQPQTQAALFTRHVAFDQPLDRAIDSPRWVLGRTWGTAHSNVRLEARFDGDLVDRLAAAGHDIELLSEPYSDLMGHAGAAVVHKNATLEAAHDPRADGGAAGV